VDLGLERPRRVSVAVRVLNRPGPLRAVLPRMRTSVSVVVPSLNSAPPLQARLPRRTTWSSARVPPLLSMPPPRSARPPVIVIPFRTSDPRSMSNTRDLPPPLRVSRLAPGPMIVVVAGSVRTSGPPVSRIVCDLAPCAGGSRMIVSGPG
jgi:hypothetical protein